MDPKRILIVEPDHAFALSLASLFRDDGCATAVAPSAAAAEREIAARRPNLLLVRAELPDLSGFSLCARLRKDPESARLPVILFSSESSQEALAEHARTAAAASGYLGMPLDTEALRGLARQLLSDADVETADDAVVEEASPAAGAVELRMGDDAGLAVALALGQGPTDGAPPEAPGPPPVPRRARRSALTDEDRLFLERVFQSIAERKAHLVAESHRRRPAPTRQLLATPEGRLQLLREDLKWREAQIARLSEIWEVRERELAHGDDRLHDKDVQLQELKLQIEDLLRKLVEARDLFIAKEREHGASLEGLLSEKFGQEKELIEVIAANERKIHELHREVRLRDEDLQRRGEALDSAAREIQRLELEAQEEQGRFQSREEDLSREVADHLQQIAGLEGELEGLGAESAEREAELRTRIEGLGEELTREREANAAREADLADKLATAEGRAERLERGLEEARAALAERAREGERLRSDLDGLGRESRQKVEELSARSSEQERLLGAARAEMARLSDELSAARRGAMLRDSELQGEISSVRARGDSLTALLAAASQERDELRGQGEALAAELSAARSEAAELGEKAGQIESRLAAVEEEKARLEGDRDRQVAEAAQRLARATEDGRALEQAAAASRARIAELERGAQAGEALLRELQARLARAERSAAESAARMDAAGREAQARQSQAQQALQLVQARQQEELLRREQARVEEVQRLQQALQEKTRQLTILDLEVARLRGVAASRPAAAAPAAFRPATPSGAGAPSAPEPAGSGGVDPKSRGGEGQ